jgi:hypothetical protein
VNTAIIHSYQLEVFYLENYVRTVLDSRGITLPEGDYGILAGMLTGIAQLRAAAEEEMLDDLNMQLLLIPQGGEGQ